MSRKVHMLILTLLIALCGLGLLVLVRCGLRIPCPINLITGLNCAGCGNTRAVMALSRFDFKQMLHYNIIFPLEAVYVIRVYFISVKNYIKNGKFSYKTASPVIDIVFLTLLIVWTIVRNCTPLF